MSRRSSTTLEAKLRAIEMYQQGTASIARIARETKVCPNTIRGWTRQYEHSGVEAIMEHERNRSYTKEFKIEAVQSYLRGEGSIEELRNQRGILSTNQLATWVKKYNGHEEIRDYDPKGDVYMTKSRATTNAERKEIVNWCMMHEQSYKLTAERYKVSYGQVYAWVTKYLQKGEKGLIDMRGHRKPEEIRSPEERQARELKRLQTENEWLKMENEVLKKVEEIERRLYSEKYGKKRNT
jgi:transposase